MPKKQNIVWRATKAVASGTAKAGWWVLKNSGKGIYAGGSKIVTAIHEKRRESLLKKQPHYSTPPELSKFNSHNILRGDFNEAERRVLHDSLILLIFGKRGSGKSSLGFRILENIKSETGRNCAVLGVPSEVLPYWISSVDSLEALPNGSAVLVDEGAIAFSSRESMNTKNRELGKLMAIARHKDLSLIFITQNTGMLDKNILKLTDTLLIKEGSLLQLEMERPEIKKFYEKASQAFSSLEGDRKQYVYVIDSDFEGVVSAALPGFWNVSISKSRSNTSKDI